MTTLILIAGVVIAVMYWPKISGALGSVAGNLTAGMANAQAVNVIGASASAVAGAAPTAPAGQTTGDVMLATAGAAQAAAFVPGVGSIISSAISALGKIAASIFKGADPTQVASAEIQQVYDLVGLNLANLGKGKMLPQSLLLQAMEAIQTACAQAETDAVQAGKVDAAVYNRSKLNIQADLQLDITAVSTDPSYSVEPTMPVNLIQARANYWTTENPGMIGGGHYYAWSANVANQITDAFIEALPQGAVLT